MFGSGPDGTSEQQLDRSSLPGTKFGASENHSIPHTLKTHRGTGTHSHTHTHPNTQVGGTAAAAADGETILATLKHGSHTRLHVLKPVSKERKWKVVMI